MKKIILFLMLLSVSILDACPTCIGRARKNSPPFFSKEYYEPTKSKKQKIKNKKNDDSKLHKKESS